MNILYINACVRENSRTDQAARRLLKRLGTYTEVKLEQLHLSPLMRETLESRTEKIEQGHYSDPEFDNAKQFADADVIVISAPFWDLSFPSLLKIYLERIYIVGIVTQYGSDGIPHGMCHAKKLYYVTTAGGKYEPQYSYDYVQNLAVHHFGIAETELIAAEMLDVDWFDAKEIMNRLFLQIDEMPLD